jgi:ABC-type phosphate/phosphonate transport system substrate-binding protein
MADAERSNYRVLYSSRPVPNISMSVSPRVTAEQKRILLEKFTNAKTAAPAKRFFEAFSKEASQFEPANLEEFEELDLLLKNFSYGW